MSDDLRELLDHTAGESPLGAFDTKKAIKRGQGALTRRRVAVGGLTTGVAAIVAAAMVVLPGAMAPNGGTGNAAANPSASSSQATDDVNGLPELDPKKFYMWQKFGEQIGEPNTEKQNATTEAYYQGFSDYVNATYGGYDAEMSNGFRRYDNQLVEWDAYPDSEQDDPHKIVRTQPQYFMSFGIRPHEGTGPLVKGGKGGPWEVVHVNVWSPGGFTDGTNGNPVDNRPVNGAAGWYDLINCDDFTMPIQAGQTLDVKVSCGTSASAKGERVVTATQRVAYDGGDWVTRVTVLYRADGSAVVVKDMAGQEDNGVGDVSFSAEELTGFASSLPDGAVK